MEWEKMKRAREGDDQNENNNAKKRDVEKEKEGCSCSESETWESHLALGVFDFPWLKDGAASKSEDYMLDFQDNFSSLLEQEDAFLKAASIDFSKANGLCESPEAKLEDLAWQPFESDMLELEEDQDVDCIWSSLLNQPL